VETEDVLCRLLGLCDFTYLGLSIRLVKLCPSV
jgi:hypothetical protein